MILNRVNRECTKYIDATEVSGKHIIVEIVRGEIQVVGIFVGGKKR